MSFRSTAAGSGLGGPVEPEHLLAPRGAAAGQDAGLGLGGPAADPQDPGHVHLPGPQDRRAAGRRARRAPTTPTARTFTPSAARFWAALPAPPAFSSLRS